MNMKRIFSLLALALALAMQAQQVPNPSFEDWSGEKYDGQIQPASWHTSNVTQVGMKFNFAHQENGHTGSYSLMVQDTEVGAMGITEVSPGYFSLGQPWTYLPSITEVGKATAGTTGGINFTYRPDTMSVWIKRTGSSTDLEDFHLLYYAWSGTAKGSKYLGKNGGCTSISQTNEESDIRIALDGNECGTDTKGNQIAEGWWRERKTYGEWTNIRVPIYYMNNDVPQMMNIIFSASNYPNFRANSGMYTGNSLYVDDVELIYSSKIDRLYIGGKEWKGFNPNGTEEMTYSLGRSATAIPEIKGVRGAGTLTNTKGTTVSFAGRELTNTEMSIQYGEIDGAPCVITVKSEDGKSTTTYRVKFVREASTNAKLASISVNGSPIKGFQPALYNYTVELPYGTTNIPEVSVEKQEDEQVVSVTQATSVTGTATVNVTAGDKKTQAVYTIGFKVAQLSDNTLKDIKINGVSLAGFNPNQTTYRVSLPTTTTTMPVVEAVSAYAAGEQTITHTKPSTIDGGVYQISVSTKGNPTPKIYKLTFKLEASSYSLLSDLQMGENLITDFRPEQTTYYVNLPVGTTVLPEISYVKGEATQTVSVEKGGLDGTSKVRVVAGNGINSTEYKISVSTAKSEISTLNMIYVGGEALKGFDPNTLQYAVELPIGTSALPAITVEKGDEYQTVNVLTGGVNGVTRITVTAQNGATTVYQLAFSVHKATDATLKMIYLDGKPLEGFDPQVLEYNCPLPKGTTELPIITYDQADEYQTVTVRNGGVNGDYKITVRPQTGTSQTYVLHFSVAVSDNANLNMIYLDGKPLKGFRADSLDYVVTLPMGVSQVPEVTYEKAEPVQKVLNICANNVQTIKVTAENGKVQTYTITFIIQRSESAFLNMIYLDGKPLEGFDKNTFEYTVVLEKTTCPVITVDKEEGQQITIITPHAAGEAQIVVKPESAPANTYRITFVQTNNAFTLLQNIYVNGKPLEGFAPDKFEYTVSITDGKVPDIGYEALPEQVVSIFRQGDMITLYVVTGKEKVQYTLALALAPARDCRLASILVDSVEIDGFAPDVYAYTLPIAANNHITYVKQYDAQVVHAGMQDANTYSLLVSAPSGDTVRYTLDFVEPLSSDANLIDLIVEGYTIEFEPTTYEYHLVLPEGYDLPMLTAVTQNGQSVAIHAASHTEQQVVVTAENGNTATYRVIYERNKSDNALLADILVDGKSLDGFAAEQYEYTHTLAWRTKVVPCVQPIGAHPDQVITTYHSAVNGTTRIHVLAADSTSEQVYTIHFPVVKSDNVALEYIMLDHETLFIDYDPEVTDYHFALPYGETAAPIVLYQAQEPEQRVQFISRPLGQTTQLIVTAENGEERTYNLHFTPTYATEPNQLASLTIAETGQALDPAVLNHTVALPYGTRTMTVAYTKHFAEQTVWMQPNGVHGVTTITVKSNRPDEQDVVYTLTPKVEMQDPAVLTDISVNGATIEGFDKNRFSYIVNIEGNPLIVYQAAEGAQVQVLTQDAKHWQAQVSANGRTNIYDIWYYYQNDVVPNTEFSEWENAQYNGVKPVGWNTLGNVANKYSSVGTYTTGNEVTREGEDVVKLSSVYNSFPLGGFVPAYITLGDINARFSVAAGSSFSVTGGITFRNSPDQMSVRFMSTALSNSQSRIVYQLSGSKMNNVTQVYTNSETQSEFTTITMDLSETNANAGLPQSMNIILNSFESESGRNGLEAQAATMFIDYCRLTFNSTLTGLTVNGEAAVMDGNAFTYTLTDSEDTSVPTLAFAGEVADQAQRVLWAEPIVTDGFSVRNATITNYAEDGTSTEYTLAVRRPLNTINTLSDLLVGGNTITAFVGTKTDYEVHLASTTKHLPDVQPVAGSSLQTITTAYADSTMTITVTPEVGETTTYTVRFITDLSDDTTLANITATGINYDPEVKEYTITADQMPDITFVKKMDGQTVNLLDGVLHVTAENGATGTYTITLNRPETTTNGQLADIEVNGVSMQGFSSDTYDYTIARPETVGFRRSFDTDSVIFTQAPEYMQWQVFGTDAHTYRITYPNQLSSSTFLKAIYVNGIALEGFNEQIYDYVYPTDSTVHIHAVANDRAAHLDATHTTQGDTTIYTYTVTAEDGTVGTPYTLTIVPNLGHSPLLKGIWADGQLINGFHPDSLQYTITLPVGAYKTAEPSLPSLTYQLGAARQRVEMEYGLLGETTNIIVTSEDGAAQAVYQLLIEAEPSHCTALTGIAVNGKPIENFDSRRHYYSVKIDENTANITWASNDNFQTVTLTTDGFSYTLHVLAQDGITASDYTIEVYNNEASDDVTLAEILLNGLTFNHFEPALNEGLEFSPMQQRYTIHLPSGTLYLPEVTARLNTEGQTVQITNQGHIVAIHVTAADGVSTNTYTLHFDIPKSNNAHLRMIYLDGEPLSTFMPEHYNYFIDLPMGQTVMPDVYAEPQEATQTVLDSITGNLQHTIYVTAEDGTKHQYLLAFNYNPSQADTLLAIYADGVLIDGFRPDSFYYAYTLPVGTTQLPEISWDEADKWQEITANTAYESPLGRITQLQVIAMSGRKNTYTISYEIEQSTVDTLQMIYVQGDSIKGFDAHTNDYYLYLAAGDSIAPSVAWQEGDEFQNVDAQLLPYEVAGVNIGWKQVLNVQAQNGSTRIYTIYFLFSRVLSTNTNLLQIYLDGKPLQGFNPEQYNYTHLVPEGATRPAVMVEKAEPTQHVDILHGDTTRITVTAEDTKYTATYTIIFTYQQSPYSFLEGIYQDGVLIDGFRPDSFLYDVTLPYGTIQHPNFTYNLGKEGQTVTTDTFQVNIGERTQTTYRFAVTAPDPMYSSEYDVRVIVALNDDCSLQSLSVRGAQVEGFHPDTTHYQIFYPIGTDSADLATITDIEAIAKDPQAVVTITANGVNFTIQVDAQDGEHSRVYTIDQVILLSDNALLSAIYLDSVLIRDFNPNCFEYTYYIVGAQPSIEAIAQDENAIVEYGMYALNEPFYIYVTAHDGTECIYTIHFLESTIQSAQTPTEKDVIIKHIAGTMDFVAATIRKNVSLGVYTAQGQLLFYSKLTESTQNDATVGTNADGSDRLLDVFTQPTVFTLPEANRAFFYVFFENEKNRITSGKIMIRK